MITVCTRTPDESVDEATVLGHFAPAELAAVIDAVNRYGVYVDTDDDAVASWYRFEATSGGDLVFVIGIESSE